MLKKLQLIVILALASAIGIANPVTRAKAKNTAVNWYAHYTTSTTGNYSISDSIENTLGGLTTFYIYIFSEGGFVMVAADDAVVPVLGYSTNELFDKNNIPESAQAFFNDYSAEISRIVMAGLDNTATAAKWADINAGIFEDAGRATTAVTPMLTTLWDQMSPYNNLCPSPSSVPTGCVATAMSQVMKKWNYPTMGVGSHSYVHPTYGTQTANFGATTYQWANMTNTYSGTSTAAEKAAVSTLMYHCGVAVNMQYTAGSSGAYTTDVPNAFVNYFAYQPTCEVKYRSLYATDVLWLNMIEEEMNEGRVLMLAGDNNGTAGTGHEFVCDGYNGASHVHINWGWSGSSNGYFGLTALNPGSQNFSSNRAAVIRIRPYSTIVPIADFTASTTIPAVGAPTDFTDASLNNPTSWTWYFDGGTPSTSTSQNPTGITFSTNGYHLVSLIVSNANGSDIKTKERYIKVGGAPTVWTKQNTAFTVASRGVDQISILDANTVWAKAYDGTNPTGYIREFTRTNDGGTTWTPGTISFTNSQNYGVSNIYPMSYTTAYACMFPTTGTGGAIVKTTDGGTTWAIQSSAPFTGSWADFVHFFDANNGVCMGDPTATTASDFVIYTTTNGGTTWTQVSTGTLPNSLANEAGIVNEYSAVGNTIWFSTNKGRIFKSTNKGLSWSVTTTGLSNSYQVKFKDANNGIIVLDTIPYTMRKTTNGGTTWTTLTPTGYLVQRPQIAFVPGTASTWFDVAASPSNGSSKSLDDCSSFVNVDTGSVQFLSVSFYDAATGWAGSFNTNSTDGGIYKWNPTPPITASASTTNVMCYGGSTGSATITASGGTPPYTYSWAPAGGTGATASGLAAGTYTCTITGGTVTSTQTVVITQPSAVAAIITSTTNAACNGTATGSASSVATGGTGALTYSWMPSGGTAATASGLAAGNYTVTATDANGCSTTANAVITEPAALMAAAAAMNVTCYGSADGMAMSTYTGGTGSVTYLWIPSGSTAASASGLTAGTYTVTITDANGCNATSTTTVTQPSPVVTAMSSTDETVTGNGTASALPTGGSPGYTYLWAPSGGTAATATGLTAGTYTVTVTDMNGCSDVQSVVVTSTVATGVAMNELQSSVSVYPNPSDGHFTLSINAGSGKCGVSVMNATGQLIYNIETELMPGGNVLPLNMEAMPGGLYIISITTGSQTARIPVSVIKE